MGFEVFSEPQQKAHGSNCYHSPFVARSFNFSHFWFLVHLSWRLHDIRRPSVVNFSHFWLLFWNCWTEFNETWQEATSSTKFVFFGPIGKTRWPPWPLIGWDIFDFSKTAERNSTKLYRKQDLNVFYQVCVFPFDREKDGYPSLWLAETFSTSLKSLNWIQRNLTGSKTPTASTKFVFFGPIGTPRWPIGLWLVETFSSSPLKPLNWIQRNLTGSKISTSSTNFVFADQSVNKKNGRLSRSAKKMAHCTQVHDMWPFGPLVFAKLLKEFQLGVHIGPRWMPSLKNHQNHCIGWIKSLNAHE